MPGNILRGPMRSTNGNSGNRFLRSQSMRSGEAVPRMRARNSRGRGSSGGPAAATRSQKVRTNSTASSRRIFPSGPVPVIDRKTPLEFTARSAAIAKSPSPSFESHPKGRSSRSRRSRPGRPGKQPTLRAAFPRLRPSTASHPAFSPFRSPRLRQTSCTRP